MKSLYKLFALTTGLLALFACETDRDSSPVLNEPDTFVLNVPAFASSNVHSLKNSESLESTCIQPDCGIPMATTYSVQVSLGENFVDAHIETNMETNYTTLGTTHFSAKMEMKASELALALGGSWSASSDEKFPTTPIPVYVHLKAGLTNNGHDIASSNVIELPKVLGCKAIPPLELPSSILVNGSTAGGNWSNWVSLAVVNRMSKFFSLSYFGGTDMLKFGTKKGEYTGLDDPRLTIASDAFIGSDDGSGGQNISVNVTGWYTVIMSVSTKRANYAFTLDIAPDEAYLVGNAIKDWIFDDKGKLQASTMANTDFVSPICTGGRELRMSIRVPGEDWRRTEFTTSSGKIVFRENKSVIDSWSEIGPEYAVNIKVEQKVNLNLVQKVGSVTQ